MDVAPLAVAFEPRVAPVVDRWTRMTAWQRRMASLDDLAEYGGLTPAEFFGAISRAAFQYTADVADLMVVSAFPDVVHAGIKRALQRNGFEDRLLLFEHMDAIGQHRLPARKEQVS